MSERRLITRKELAKLAQEARGELSQKEVADQLGVSQPAISKAENDMDASLDKLRIRIIEEYTNYRVENPSKHFEVVEPD